MPWSVKRVLVLIVLGFIAAGLAIIVLIRHRNVEDVLLAVLGLVGAVAMIVVALPSDGKEDR
jgi:hypothetical protein